jgi:glycine betaine transporter
MNKVTSVFWVSLIVTIAFVLWGIFSPEQLGRAMSIAQAFFLNSFGWFYQLCATFFL